MASLDPFSSVANRWVTCPEPNPGCHLRLFCFPHAGSGTAVFQGWTRSLSPDVEFCAIRLPGREGRMKEPPFVRLQPLIKAMAEALMPLLDRPFAFFGHSMGALLSFELARYLRRRFTLLPAYLFASGSNAPQMLEPARPLHLLPDAMFLEEVRRRFDGIPEEIRQDSGLMQLFLPTLRADITMIETYVYRYEAPLQTPISVFAGEGDSEVSAHGLTAWAEQTTGAFRLRHFAGGHFYLHSAQAPLLEAVNRDLIRLRFDLLQQESRDPGQLFLDQGSDKS